MWVDPLAAGLISCMILGCTVPLLQQSAETLLQRTPRVLVRDGVILNRAGVHEIDILLETCTFNIWHRLFVS